jgi:prepilin-type N-terminal cleavage/methylation domain-containing protein/prepilin-type processing-associated H-X9-DG protein
LAWQGIKVKTEVGGSKTGFGFTLVELLVVMAILAVLAALLFPVFATAKKSAKRTDCMSNVKQILVAEQLYLGDFDQVYPQTRQASPNPDVEDVAGTIDEPIFQQVFHPIQVYVRNGGVGQPDGPSFACPEDSDPFGKRCLAIDPDSPDVTSYVVNGYFVFGLGASSVTQPSTTVFVAERRSDSAGAADPFCDDIYHPWFDSSNLLAPDQEMDASTGAMQTRRHLNVANYGFVDTHVQALPWQRTYSPPKVNFHLINQSQ